jgi:hypothetical protein
MNRILSTLIFVAISLNASPDDGIPSGTYSEAFQYLLEGGSIREISADNGRCGFPLMAEISVHWENLTDIQKEHVATQLKAPTMQNSILSPMGYFRIHYDTSGTHRVDPVDTGGNGIPDYIDSVAAVFDYVWEFEVDILGYDPPGSAALLESGTANGLYNVYVQNLGSQYYGYTAWNQTDRIERNTAAPTYNTYIVINTRFEGFYTTGINALRVTAAHEFHHAVQLAGYGFWSSEIFFYEITSTWMEDVVYPGINDYYQYLPSVFSANTYTSPFYDSASIRMYGRALWGHMMARRYGRDIMRRKWELLRHVSPLRAIQQALAEVDASFEQELAEFNMWLFYTGHRARPDKYFPKGEEYPVLQLKSSPVFHSGHTVISANDVRSQTLHFHSVVTEQGDTLFFLISNVNTSRNSDNQWFNLIVSDARIQSGSMRTESGLWYLLEGDTLSHWRVLAFETDDPVIAGGIKIFPNPFVLPSAPSVSFVIEEPRGDVELYIYTSSMRLIRRDAFETVEQLGRTIVRWDGRDDRGDYVSSGIYIYVLRTENNTTKGSFTVIRN